MATTEVNVCNMALARIGHTTALTGTTIPTSDTSAAGTVANLLYDQVRDQLLTEYQWPWATGWQPLKRLDEATVIWASGTTYAVGDLVTHDSVDWVSIQAGSAQDPTSATTYWRAMAYSASYTYGLGDVATYDDESWVSLQASNLAHTPDADGSETWWALLHSNFEYVYAYPTDCLAIHMIYSGSQTPTASEKAVYEYRVEQNKAGTGRIIATDIEDAVIRYTRALETVTLFPASFVDALTWRLAAEFCMPLQVNEARAELVFKQAQFACDRAFAQALNEEQPGEEQIPSMAARS